jgi:hypothetical protein
MQPDQGYAHSGGWKCGKYHFECGFLITRQRARYIL